MYCISLQSGSNGNAIYVESEGVRLLFDAGISGSRAAERLAAHGRDIRDVHAVILSHDHRDHVQCAGIYQRKFGLPLWMSPPTLQACGTMLGRLRDVRHFETGSSLAFNGLRVHTLRTPHDACDGCAFVVESAGRRLGLLTDLGHPFAELGRVLSTLDAVVIESNYDPGMLDRGPYPPFLRERIRGPQGHLSNEEAAVLVERHGRRLQWAAIGHLSEENNALELALETHRQIHGGLCPVHHASRYGVSDLWEV